MEYNARYVFGRTLAGLCLTPALAVAQPTARQAAPAYRPRVDIIDYELTFDLPGEGKSFEARALLTVRRRGPLDTLVLDLVGLRVDSVLVNGAAVRFVRDSSTVRVPLPPGPGDSLGVVVRYGGEPRDGLIISTDSAGRWMAFGDNWPNRARYWIPSVDHPSDKATVTWIVRAPSNLRIVANGELAEETPLLTRAGAASSPGERSPVDLSRTLTRWREARPIPMKIMVLAAAPLVYFDLGRTACGLGEFAGCVRQAVYAAPESRDFLPGPFARAGEMVALFARLAGPFPYEKLAHLQSTTRYGGMENASAIFYSSNAFTRRTLSTGLVAHETAHQWFGDAVTERDWPHVWLSEGFATYYAQLWVEHAEGDSAFRAGMRTLREQIIGADVVKARPVIDTAQTDLNALLNTNSYQKGGWVLHMLRRELGDSAFFRGIRSYYAKYRHANADTDDLRRELERSSGRELGAFFEQWLRRPGFPELTTSWSYDATRRGVVLIVEQSPARAPFAFPLTVEVTDASGSVHTVRLRVPGLPRSRVAVPVSLTRAPRAVRMDPRVELLASVKER